MKADLSSTILSMSNLSISIGDNFLNVSYDLLSCLNILLSFLSNTVLGSSFLTTR